MLPFSTKRLNSKFDRIFLFSNKKFDNNVPLYIFVWLRQLIKPD